MVKNIQADGISIDFNAFSSYTYSELLAHRTLWLEYDARVCLTSASDGVPSASNIAYV